MPTQRPPDADLHGLRTARRMIAEYRAEISLSHDEPPETQEALAEMSKRFGRLIAQLTHRPE